MKKDFAEMPGPLPSHPGDWMEILKIFAANPLTYLENLRAQYGNIFVLIRNCATALTIPNCAGTVVAIGPELNRTILLNLQLFHSASPETIKHAMTPAARALSYSLRTHNPEQHKKSRKLFAPIFSSKSVDNLQPVIIKCAEDFFKTWKNDTVIDLEAELRNLCLQLTNQVIFGETITKEAKLSRVFFDLLDIRRQRDFTKEITEKEKLLKLFLSESDKVVENLRTIIRNVRKFHREDSIFSSLCLLTENNEYAVSEEELIGTANSLTLSSVDTITSALCWTLFLISVFPAWEEKLLLEVNDFYQQEKFSYKDLDQLSILDSIIKESLRLLPPSSLLIRRTAVSVELDGYSIPADTEIIFSPYLTHHLAEIYPNPKKFLPERWQTIHPTVFEYLPFSAGPKSCLGENLAISQIKIVLVTLLKRHRLKFLPENIVDWSISTVLKPIKSIKMQIQRVSEYKPEKQGIVKVKGTINELVDIA